MEYEANVFAAEFMLSDDTVLEALEMQMDFYQTAKCLYVPPELLDFKLRILQCQGVRIIAPYIAHGDFEPIYILNAPPIRPTRRSGAGLLSAKCL